MNIPLVNLQRNYQRYANDYNRILLETAASCQFIMGDALRKFEADFAAYLGVKHLLGVSSGTDALTLLLKAHGVAGKKVLIQNNTFIATALAVANAGGEILLCDIDAATYQMDVASYCGPTPDIVMPVHLYGYPYDVEKIKKRFGEHIIVIEDACQAHGSILRGERCGSLGLGAGFSFYPGKNLGAFGDGGAVATDDDNLAEEIMALRNWGGRVKYVHDREGGNSRLDTLQAAILDFKLSQLDDWNQTRNERARQYRQLLSDCADIILPPEVAEDSLQNYHLFVIRLPQHDRKLVLQQLNNAGVGAGIHYPVPIHRQQVYRDMDFAKATFPVSTTIASEIISLPLCPDITASEVERVAEVLLNILNSDVCRRQQ